VAELLGEGGEEPDGGEAAAQGEREEALEQLRGELARLGGHEEVQAVLQGSREGISERIAAVEGRLSESELACVQAYAGEASALGRLQGEVRSCHAALESLEALLASFQLRLGQLASDIKALQESSLSLSMRLANRRAAEASLSSLVLRLTVPPELSKGLAECDVESEHFSLLLSQLGDKLDSLARLSASDEPPLALESAKPQLERLRARAAQRCRESLTSRFAMLRKPRTNVQIVQQNVLAPLAPLARFLCKHSPSQYANVKSAYSSASAKVLKNSLAAYATALYKTKSSSLSRNELLGTKPLDGNPQPHKFQLGERATALAVYAESSPVVISRLEAAGESLGWEEAFRSAHKVLLDCATSEYLFCSDFWAESSAEMFDAVFSGVLSQVEYSTGREISHCNDPVALLIAAKCVRNHQLVMARRAVPALDPYHDRVALLLWPRAKKLLEDNAKSLESIGARTAQFENLHSPHQAILRYAELGAAVDVLSSETDGHLDMVTERLRDAAWALVERVGSTFANSHLEKEAFKAANAKAVKEAFQRENSSFALNAGPSGNLAASSQNVGSGGTSAGTGGLRTGNSGTSSSSGSVSLAHSNVGSFFESKLENALDAIADSEAQRCMGEIISVVEELEPRNGSDDADEALRKATEALRSFGGRWRKALHDVDNGARTAVGGDDLGREAAQKALSKSLSWYARLAGQGGILQRMGERGRQIVSKDSVGQPAILGEVKRLTQQ
jgi:hypothetical protein